MQPTIEIRPFAPHSPEFPGAIAVYRSYAHQPEDDAKGYFTMYADRADYTGLVAMADQAVVGMCFGAKVSSGNWWFDAVAGGLPDCAGKLAQAWTLNELGVLPSFQRRGVAGALLKDLSRAIRWPYLVLSTGVDNLPARGLYRAMGWVELGTVALSKKGSPSVVCLLEQAHGTVVRDSDVPSNTRP